MVRLLTAVPAGTPGRSLTPVVLNQTTLRAFEAATSTLKTVPSGMRYRPRSVPSRSETAIVILALESGGRRITARVVFAVATAFMMISLTSLEVSLLGEEELLPLGPTRNPSGGTAPAAISSTAGTL